MSNSKNITLENLTRYDTNIKEYIAIQDGKTVEKASAYSIDNAVDYPIVDLRLYGKSTQDGTPTPDAPVDIVSIGDSGAVKITSDNGGDISLTANITSALPLCGIPVDTDGNYTDSTGQQWICDELIYNADGTGKVVKRTAKIDSHNGETVIEPYLSITGSLTTGATVIYALAEPQEIELSAAEIAQLEALQTFNGITNISNDSGAEMRVKYCTNKALSGCVLPIIDSKADKSHTHSKSDITDFPTSLPANGGNADTVNGLTVQTAVPANAKFTDTVYTHPASGVTAGTYKSVTVNDKGHVTAGSNPTTLAGYGITDAAAKSHTHDDRYYTESEINTKLNTKLNASLKGTANGLAELDSNGKVPSAQLPSYVDDVLEYTAKTNFPSTGETGKIYVDTTANKTYRWSGSTYVEISASIALGETSSTAYRGDRGKIAYDHSQTAHAPSNAQANQNAFSNIVVGSTTVAADSPTDSLTLVAGNNVTITPDATNDKITIASKDTVYTHPTTSGNKHIPSGGSSGQILRWSADGTAAWGADNNTDTKVTAVGNHYTPSGGTTTSASGGTLTDITNSSSGVQVVTGVTKDAAGHVTGVTSVALKSVNTTYSAATASAAGLVSTSAQTFAGNKTFNGQIIPAGASNVTSAQARKIYAGTDDMTAGTSELETGTIYLVYE